MALVRELEAVLASHHLLQELQLRDRELEDHGAIDAEQTIVMLGTRARQHQASIASGHAAAKALAGELTAGMASAPDERPRAAAHA